jgi:acyl-[acyl-carrier-protein] desaturase
VLEHRLAVMRALEPSVTAALTTLPPPEGCWQPSDVLPTLHGDAWRDEVEELRAEAARLSDEMLVVLVGNVVTEEALPAYLATINRCGGMTDRTGVDAHPWAQWARSWTAEEKRHGDAGRGYLLLSGRVDLLAVERTVQHLLRNGFDNRAGGDPYRGLAYASFQEHATKLAWIQLGRLAGTCDAPRLHRLCGLIAADEARHERAYVSVLRDLVAHDPCGALEALEETLCGVVVMPARTMTDGLDRNLFGHFADVGQRLGVYTYVDYAENLRQLLETLDIAHLTGLPAAAAESRDLLCAAADRHRAAAAEATSRKARPVAFSWISGRRV